MRAAVVSVESSARRLSLVEVAAPETNSGLLLVAVKAVSLNHGEVHDALHAAADGYRPGWDLSGVVVEAPLGSGFSVGQRVVAMTPQGAWAEQVLVPPILAAPIPNTVSFEAAATLPVAGMTAAVALSKRPLSPGERLLVTGATGGVGVYAIQLARAAGAHVTAFTRDGAHEGFLRDLGADDVAVGVDAAQQRAPFDLILEGTGGTLLGHALGWLKSQGACVLFGDAAGDQATTFDARRFRLGGGGLFGGTMLYGLFLGEELMRTNPVSAPALLTQLSQKLAEGTLRPIIGKTARWTEVDAVSRALLARSFNGKAVLTLP